MDLERAYLDDDISPETANKMARKAGIKALYSGVINSEAKILLKASQFTTLTDAIQKTIEYSTEQGNTSNAQLLNFERRSNNFNNNHRNNSSNNQNFSTKNNNFYKNKPNTNRYNDDGVQTRPINYNNNSSGNNFNGNNRYNRNNYNNRNRFNNNFHRQNYGNQNGNNRYNRYNNENHNQRRIHIIHADDRNIIQPEQAQTDRNEEQNNPNLHFLGQ